MRITKYFLLLLLVSASQNAAGITYGKVTQFTTDKTHSPGEEDNPRPEY